MDSWLRLLELTKIRTARRLFYFGKTPSYTIRVLKKKGEYYERYNER